MNEENANNNEEVKRLFTSDAPIDPEAVKAYSRIYTEFIAESVTNRSWNNPKQHYRQSLEFGRNLRDNWIHTYPIIPGAMITFTDVATSRSWQIIGKPVTANRTVARLNNSFMIDRYGIEHKGFEQLFSRMCWDWLTVGRAMFHSHPLLDNERDWSPLEYIDPAYTWPVGTLQNAQWQYRPVNGLPTRTFVQDQIFFMDNVRIGHTGAIMGRVAYLIPIANLVWLMMQHDTLQLDGRKIREIFLVRQGLGKSLIEALTRFMALASGEDPSKLGIPVMEAETYGDNVPMSDLLTRVGISEVPREFSRADLEGRYVREISATLGLPIGQFWYDPRGTNRSLEQVQQERSTLKGPAFLVRSFCRLINNAKMMGETPGNRAVLSFEEETDSSSLQMQSEAVKIYSEAAMNIEALAPGLIQPKDWLEFFHRLHLIPPSATLPGYSTYEENDLQRKMGELVNLPRGTTFEELTDRLLNTLSTEERRNSDMSILEKGTVRMNLDGYVVEYRPSFQIGWQ